MVLRSLSLTLLVLGASVAPQATNEAPVLEIRGDVSTPLTLDAEAFAALPRAQVNITSEGVRTVYEGVYLHVLLERAGAPLGDALRGKALATYVLAEAEDGYQVLFSLAELDPAFVDNQILVADRANGKPLFGRDGRLRIVSPGDKRGARSIRMLERLTVVRLRK